MEASLDLTSTTPAAPPVPTWRGRAAPIACGCAMVLAAGAVAAIDPSGSNSPFPSCIFHITTGLWCPGCGLTRATHALLRGDVPAALGYNLFTPFVLFAIVASWFIWLRRSWGVPMRTLGDRLPNRFGAVAATTMLVYGVLRNLPVPALRWLAP